MFLAGQARHATMGRMEEVIVRPISLERLAAILPADRAARLEAAAERARATFGDRVVWHVNATAHGGGVAEMLQTLLAYGKGAGIENRWLVLDGDPHVLRDHQAAAQHAARGTGRRRAPRAARSARTTRRCSAPTSRSWLARVSPRDIVLLHDPQTAGLAEGLRELGARVVWRCHVGRDRPNDLTRVAWEFLRPYLGQAQALVFSRREYAPEWVEDERLVVIPPSIDPFAAKNMPLRSRRRRAPSWPGRGWSRTAADRDRSTSSGATARPARCGPIAARADS